MGPQHLYFKHCASDFDKQPGLETAAKGQRENDWPRRKWSRFHRSGWALGEILASRAGRAPTWFPLTEAGQQPGKGTGKAGRASQGTGTRHRRPRAATQGLWAREWPSSSVRERDVAEFWRTDLQKLASSFRESKKETSKTPQTKT